MISTRSRGSPLTFGKRNEDDMSEGAIGIIILIAISVITTVAVHLFLRRYFSASLIAAVLSSAIFQFIAILHVGYLDPFLPIALLVGGALAYAIALIVGLIILAYRKTLKSE